MRKGYKKINFYNRAWSDDFDITKKAGKVEIIKEGDKKIEYASFKCPVCGSNMVLRTQHKDGKKFWGCVKFQLKGYRKCNGTRYYDGGIGKDKKQGLKSLQENRKLNPDFINTWKNKTTRLRLYNSKI